MKVKEPNYKYENVLLVDDSELDNFINEKTIEANHFARKIYVNSSAKSALEFLSNLVTMGNKFSEAHPDVIFIDINMPMMDGFQFIDSFKKMSQTRLKTSRLVILTSSVYHEDRQKALDISDQIVFLNKPLTKDMLEKL